MTYPTRFEPSFKTGEFNFVRAWNLLARPRFEDLDESVRDLFWLTAEQSAELNQLANLSMPWPDGLREKFNINELDLAMAARIIYYFGHWGERRFVESVQRHGAYWKFACYADQWLAQQLDLPKSGAISIAIHQGALRVCAEGRDFWTWTEVCWATKEHLTRLKALLKDAPKPGESHDFYAACTAFIDKCKKAMADDPSFAEWANCGETYKQP